MGQISVSYSKEVSKIKEKFFLEEEERLIKTIADRIGHTILHKKLRSVFLDWEKAKENFTEREDEQWQGVIKLLRNTDQKLFIHITKKMLHYLLLNGFKQAKILLHTFNLNKKMEDRSITEVNFPSRKQNMADILELCNEVFLFTSKNLHGERILSLIQKWIGENKSRALVKVTHNVNSSLVEIIEALTQYQYLEFENGNFPLSIEKGLIVSLIRRFFSEQLNFINVAKRFTKVRDFYSLLQSIIFPNKSHGRLGGKSAGLFLAYQIYSKTNTSGLFSNLRIPKTWYVSSDGLSSFIFYNNLEDVIEQKYKESEEIVLEYPNIIQIFKNSHFPPEMIKGFSHALDQIGEKPIIVRSSSLLEDRIGSAFSGKYKSLFLANQGTKRERLDALMDAVAEVYASMFAPDPIEYRKEKGLLDFYEEMGIMIQEVVGNTVGKYFFPLFAGVAFSSNEFRWSARIKQEDGLIRMTPGLGTRAVDRVGDDYPFMFAPGKPNLKVNVTPDEVVRYAPKKIDVINLETNTFETVEIRDLFRQYGNDIEHIDQIVSKYQDNYIRKVNSFLGIDFEKDNIVVTFDGIIHNSKFVEQIHMLLKTVESKLQTPVDIEFAHDGNNLYILQCRPQCHLANAAPSIIPKNIDPKRIVFTAHRNVSNGKVPDITHVVYVDPSAYHMVKDLGTLKSIGHAVGQLNKILPKKQFILMGPGRWGSRGDIKLGVSVTYSDINKTSVLIEIAYKKGNYIPELSFGTHFFQDLVESSIRYLPLYPYDENVVFNEDFLKNSENILEEILPEYAHLSHTIRVIDVPGSTDGKILRILMNGDTDEAIAFLETPNRHSLPISKSVQIQHLGRIILRPRNLQTKE